MQSEEWIPAGDICNFHKVELSFILDLRHSGLIETRMRNGEVFLPSDALTELEKFVRWHYDLSINLEGIEAIAHMLTRVQQLQKEKRTLLNKLRRFESEGDWSEPDLEI
jgi:hypothetical protein